MISKVGRAKQSKITSMMKWWSRSLSKMISKIASRDVAFKASRMSESLFAAQSIVF